MINAEMKAQLEYFERLAKNVFISPTYPQGNRPMTYDTGEMSDELNEMWRLEDRLNEEGKYTSFTSGIVILHGNYTAEDLTEILKFLSTAEG